jgi:hypothetical protein
MSNAYRKPDGANFRKPLATCSNFADSAPRWKYGTLSHRVPSGAETATGVTPIGFAVTVLNGT